MGEWPNNPVKCWLIGHARKSFWELFKLSSYMRKPKITNNNPTRTKHMVTHLIHRLAVGSSYLTTLIVYTTWNKTQNTFGTQQLTPLISGRQLPYDSFKKKITLPAPEQINLLWIPSSLIAGIYLKQCHWICFHQRSCFFSHHLLLE